MKKSSFCKPVANNTGVNFIKLNNLVFFFFPRRPTKVPRNQARNQANPIRYGTKIRKINIKKQKRKPVLGIHGIFIS